MKRVKCLYGIIVFFLFVIYLDGLRIVISLLFTRKGSRVDARICFVFNY